ncbi:YchJ family protein [Thiomicrorhabdus aquaedulcis]|uniref:YchJ family protein n=1 Tax=Thiomicrorhabdus aquaedulcis TaxID=2211106 RepID=UPI000FD985B3|nr:YchJ family metal-binding protein [Thiomicrorhabdus aquaedulcis]
MSPFKTQSYLLQPCLCGSNKTYHVCCHRYHTQLAFPATAKALMRARFVAYSLHLKSYLLSTWCESTRPGQEAFELDDALIWQKLHVHECVKGRGKMREGWVSFSAHYQINNVAGVMQEKSYFTRNTLGHWCYVDGDVQ